MTIRTSWGFCVSPRTGESYVQALERCKLVYGSPDIVRFFDSGFNPQHADLQYLLSKSVAVAPTFKAKPIAILNHIHDAALHDWIVQLDPSKDVAGYWHEPEDEILRLAFTYTDYQDANRYIASKIQELNPGLLFGPVLMEYSLRPSTSPVRYVTDYFIPGVHTAILFDAYSGYAEGRGYYLAPEVQFDKLMNKAIEFDVPWGIMEFGSGARPATRPEFPTRTEWLKTRIAYLQGMAQPPQWVCYFARGGCELDSDPEAAAVMRATGV